MRPPGGPASSKPDDPFGHIAAYYDRLVERHGPTARASDYGDDRSQQLKYRVLAEVLPLEGRTVLDVGCGLGGFPELAGLRDVAIGYTGVELSPRTVELAHQLHPGRDIRLLNILQDDPGRHDVVMASGIFYLLGNDATELMRRLVERMWALAGEAVAFNSLSTWAEEQEPGEFHADPLETLHWARSLTPWVVMRHDYHPRDFTVYLYRRETHSEGRP